VLKVQPDRVEHFHGRPLHSNDTISINGSPRFNGEATTGYTGRMSCPTSSTYTYRWHGLAGCGDTPQFLSGDPEAVSLLTLPTSNTAIKTETDRAAGKTGCLYNGPTRIVLNSSGADRDLQPQHPQPRRLPDRQRRHHLRVPQRGRVPLGHPAGAAHDRGGEQHRGRRQHHLLVDRRGVQRPARADRQQLRAGLPPVNSSGTNLSDTRNPTATFQNPQIHAAILALTHSFIVQNYEEGAQLGTITVNGVIAQKWRGPVGTSGGTGYLKSYGYDSRLQFASPPFAMDLSQAPFRVNQWAEIQNPTGLPA
jgi:hypothetical protein